MVDFIENITMNDGIKLNQAGKIVGKILGKM